MNWSFGKAVIEKEALETITFQTLDYLGWVAIININLLLIPEIIKRIFRFFNKDLPDKWNFS